MSVIKVKNIFEARAGSNFNFLSIKGIEAPKRFPINIFPNTAILRARA